MFDFKQAKVRVDEVINPTHLIYSEVFSDSSNNNVYIKPENLQKTGSFKLRGAYNKLSKGNYYSVCRQPRPRGGIFCPKTRHESCNLYARAYSND